MATDNNEIEAWTLQRVISSAMALADSGRYHDFTDIDYALRFERGWPQARALIDEPAMRMALNRRCADARERSLALAVQPNCRLRNRCPWKSPRWSRGGSLRLSGMRYRLPRV